MQLMKPISRLYYAKIKIAKDYKQPKGERKVVRAKAVLTDYIGTLVNARYYSIDASRKKLHKALTEVGFETGMAEFMEAYIKAHEKYRMVRYEQLREVTNAVWVCEALNNIGCSVSVDDSRIKTALNVFFQDYVDSLEFRPCTRKLIKRIKENCKLGLVSNFTYAPVVYASLRNWELTSFSTPFWFRMKMDGENLTN
jgi:FMN phosphatase YigB (HAD superfamily)